VADLVGVIEAAGAGVGGTAAVLAVLWRPILGRHDKKRMESLADDLFMHGSVAIPGVRIVVQPAAQRLAGVETKLLEVGEHVDLLATVVGELKVDVAIVGRAVHGVGSQVKDVAHEVHTNAGGSMKDTLDGIALEQDRVATEHREELNP
jgi:hypothetical protein